jgi:hypothetical protein
MRRRFLEMQGFTGLDDATLAAIDPWIRVPPAFCMSVMLIGTIMRWEWLMFALVPLALSGAILPNHPFDILSRLDHGLRIPRSGPPRRFACAVASGWILATALAFHLGFVLIATILGSVFVVVSMIPVVTGFCVPSWTYERMRRHGKQRLATRNA